MNLPTFFNMYAKSRSLPDMRYTRVHRGGASAALIITLTALASMATAAVVVGPGFSIGALSTAPTAGSPVEKLGDRQRFANQVAGIFGGSHRVLAVHERGYTPYLEAVLWVEDRVNLGQIDPCEVAVLSHSRVLQSITWYALPSEYEKATWSDFDSSVLIVDRLSDPTFCERWRSQSHVVPRLISTGISDLVIKSARREGSDTGVMQIRVIWPEDSTDSPTETAAHVQAAMGSLPLSR